MTSAVAVRGQQEGRLPGRFGPRQRYNNPMPHTRLGILISGRGSNMQAIVRSCEERDLPATVAMVISNKATAAGVSWAQSRGLSTAVLSHKDFPDREAHDRAVVDRLRSAGVEWVCLAGYMRLLSAAFVEAYPNRILNIHPSLLPSFPGLDAQQQAWEWGVKVSGCTVHLVDLELDHGPIVLQRSVSVMDRDTADTLADRILEQEHVAYSEALRRLLNEQWCVRARRVVFL